MEMPGVQTKQLAMFDGIAQVKLMGAGHIAFRSDAEELGFDGIQIVFCVERLSENRVERFGQPLPRSLAIDGRVLEAVGNPDVGDAGSAERSPNGCPNAP